MPRDRPLGPARPRPVGRVFAGRRVGVDARRRCHPPRVDRPVPDNRLLVGGPAGAADPDGAAHRVRQRGEPVVMRLAPAATAMALLLPDSDMLPSFLDDEPASWLLPVACPAKYLTPNERGAHWRRKAAITDAWRAATYAAAQLADLPRGLTRIRIDAAIRPTTNQPRDRANYVDAAKPCVDGLGPPFVRVGRNAAAAPGWGLVADDDDTRLDGPHVAFGTKVGKGETHRIDLRITDLSGLSPRRTWTPERVTPDGEPRISVKRRCNGCRRRIGDVLPEEVAARFADLPLPDVRHECPTCREAPGA